MRTALCDLLGIEIPIILAPMGIAVGHAGGHGIGEVIEIGLR